MDALEIDLSQSFKLVTHHQFCQYTILQVEGRKWHCTTSFNIQCWNSSTVEAVFPIYDFCSELFNYLHGPHTSSALICTDTAVEYEKCGKTLLKAIRNSVYLNTLHFSTYFKLQLLCMAMLVHILHITAEHYRSSSETQVHCAFHYWWW